MIATGQWVMQQLPPVLFEKILANDAEKHILKMLKGKTGSNTCPKRTGKRYRLTTINTRSVLFL
jgi:hypothetical protein